ncbi:MAG: BrnA antitoxin family protein [Betaproteobacteria bacterium]|nr:BrnA antitoxin family protein [Betaproteobacteria bacterium]
MQQSLTLAERSDSILPDEFWINAARNPHNPYSRPTKTHATVRIDSDVMVWLKSQGKGYQTRLNAILRQAMLDAFKKAHG